MNRKFLSFLIVTLMIIGSFGLVSSTPVEIQEDKDCGCGAKGDSETGEVPLESLCGFFVPENWDEDAVFDPIIASSSIPDSFDWRTEAGGFIPVGDQTLWCVLIPIGCGSCWAFATCGVFECLIKIRDNKNVDLSEQFLISCNNDGWGCDGGYVAHKYHVSPGAVYASDFPYQLGPWCAPPDEVPCETHPHPYKLDGWSYIYPQHNGIPEVKNIQQAIFEHGPVYAAVYAGDAFGNYNGGIFGTNEPGDPNHAVVIVGWNGDYNDPNGYWIIRNSWGTGWGENGYMRIKYECSKIGFHANYAKYKDPEEEVTCSGKLTWNEVSPGGTVTGSFTVENSGEYRSFLDWEIADEPDWGTWTFAPDEGGGLGQYEEKTVQVSVRAPSGDPQTFTGTIKVANVEDSSDYDTVSVTLTTPRLKSIYHPLFTQFLSKFPLLKSLFSLI